MGRKGTQFIGGLGRMGTQLMRGRVGKEWDPIDRGFGRKGTQLMRVG